MHQGRILDIGTLKELRDRHNEDEFEELFFGLLSQYEDGQHGEWNEKVEFQTPPPTEGETSP